MGRTKVREQLSMTPTKGRKEKWIYTYWRPAIAWQYFLVCLCDFIIFPSLTFLTAKYTGTYVAWDPLTLKESGFYHLAMAAIIGVAAWTRGQEKIKMMDTFGYDPDATDDVPEFPGPDEPGSYRERTVTTQTPVKMD